MRTCESRSILKVTNARQYIRLWLRSESLRLFGIQAFHGKLLKALGHFLRPALGPSAGPFSGLFYM